MMNREMIETRLYLFLGERPSEDLDDEAYIVWQMSLDPFVALRPEIARFMDGLEWLIVQVENLDENEVTDEEIMVPFYDAAKRVFGEERSAIRSFFRYLYIILFHSESGPRWSQFIRATGKDYFLQLVRERCSSPF